MIKQNKINYFTPSGCLSVDAMKGLHSSNLEKDILKKINDHLEECELCQDAYEGFTLINNPDKITEIVNEINYNFKSKLSTPKIHPIKPNNQVLIIAFSAAASIIIILGLFFLFNQNQKETFVKQVNNIEIKEEIPSIPIPDTNTNQELKPFNPSVEDRKNMHQVGHKEDVRDDAFLSDTYESQEFYLEAIVLSTVPSMNLNPNNAEVEDKSDIEVEEELNIEVEEEMGNLALREDQVFTIVEQMPEFPEGYEELSKYLKSNLQYPQEAREKRISGRVFISFIVEENGNITHAKIVRGIGGGCDEEAREVIESMPDWIPGKQKGKAVKVQFNMPIVFKLH